MSSGWDQSRFVNVPPDSLKRLECVICLGILKDAVQLPCGHSFCQNCVNNLDGPCPIDRKDFFEELSANYTLRSLIGSYSICCQFMENCEFVGKVEDIEQHEQECDWRLVNCEQCDLEVVCCNIESHNCLEVLKEALETEREQSGYYKEQWEEVRTELEEVNGRLEDTVNELDEQQEETRCIQNELASKQSQVNKLKQKLGFERIHSRQLEHRLELLGESAVSSSAMQHLEQMQRPTGVRKQENDNSGENGWQDRTNCFEEYRGEAQIVHEVKNVRNLCDGDGKEDLSDVVMIRCLSWKLSVQFSTDEFDDSELRIGLQCDSESDNPNWTCRATVAFRLVNRNSLSESILKQIVHTFCPENPKFTVFFSWDDVMDESGGFIKDGSIIVEAKLQVYPPHGAGWDSKKYTGFVGLMNGGPHSCLNSILQTLYSTNALRKAVYQMPTTNEDISTSVPLALQSVFLKLQYNNEPVETDCLTKSLGWDSPDSIPQDTQELLRDLLWNVGEQMEGSCVEGTIQKLFESEIETYIKCDSIDLESKKTETLYDIQLKVKGKRNLYESFDEYIKVEILEGENKYDAGLYGMQEAEKGVVFLKLPAVLHLHLMRFIYDVETDSNVKINDRYEFPSELNLEKYMGKRDGNDPAIYQLQAVLVHSGDLDDGHHVVFVDPSCSGDWYKFNDDLVYRSEAEEENFGCDCDEETSNSCASMLVYIRKSQMEKVLSPVEDNDVPDCLSNQLLGHSHRTAPSTSAASSRCQSPSPPANGLTSLDGLPQFALSTFLDRLLHRRKRVPAFTGSGESSSGSSSSGSSSSTPAATANSAAANSPVQPAPNPSKQPPLREPVLPRLPTSFQSGLSPEPAEYVKKYQRSSAHH